MRLPTASSPVWVADASEPPVPPANTTKPIASSDSPIAIKATKVSVWADSVIAPVPGGPMCRETARQRRSPRGSEVYGRSVDVACTEGQQRDTQQDDHVDTEDDPCLVDPEQLGLVLERTENDGALTPRVVDR